MHAEVVGSSHLADGISQLTVEIQTNTCKGQMGGMPAYRNPTPCLPLAAYIFIFKLKAVPACPLLHSNLAPLCPNVPMIVVWIPSAALALRRASKPSSLKSPSLGWASVMRMMRFSVLALSASRQARQAFISLMAAVADRQAFRE
jgi:hypothetical protein